MWSRCSSGSGSPERTCYAWRIHTCADGLIHGVKMRSFLSNSVNEWGRWTENKPSHLNITKCVFWLKSTLSPICSWRGLQSDLFNRFRRDVMWWHDVDSTLLVWVHISDLQLIWRGSTWSWTGNPANVASERRSDYFCKTSEKCLIFSNCIKIIKLFTNIWGSQRGRFQWKSSTLIQLLTSNHNLLQHSVLSFNLRIICWWWKDGFQRSLLCKDTLEKITC